MLFSTILLFHIGLCRPACQKGQHYYLLACQFFDDSGELSGLSP